MANYMQPVTPRPMAGAVSPVLPTFNTPRPAFTPQTPPALPAGAGGGNTGAVSTSYQPGVNPMPNFGANIGGGALTGGLNGVANRRPFAAPDWAQINQRIAARFPGQNIPQFSNIQDLRNWFMANGGGLRPNGGNTPPTGPVTQPNGNTGIVPPHLQQGNQPPAVLPQFSVNPTSTAANPQPTASGQVTPAAPAGTFSQATAATGGALPQPSTPGTTQTSTPYTPTPGQPPANFSAYNVVSDSINMLTDQNSPYMTNAARRGAEYAQSRGNLNSSIGAGAARRAALEAAQPLVGEMLGLQKQREQYASQEWLQSNQFNREFAGTMALLPIKNSMDSLNLIMSYGLENPDVFTPEVVSGLSNFFTQNMRDIMSNYYGTGSTT